MIGSTTGIEAHGASGRHSSRADGRYQHPYTPTAKAGVTSSSAPYTKTSSTRDQGIARARNVGTMHTSADPYLG